MENNSPYIIIPPEHQSAPKTPVILPPSAPTYVSKGHEAVGEGYTGDDDFDRELDNPLYHNRQLQEELASLPRLTTSPQLTVEKMLEQRELNHFRSRAQRWAGQERWQGKDNEASRLVNVISPETFIARLAKAGIRAADSNPVVAEYIATRKAHCPHTLTPATCDCLTEVMGRGGPRIWLNEFVALMTVQKKDGTTEKVSTGLVGVNAWVTPEIGTKAWERGLYVARTLTSLQYPLGPEWTLMRFNQYNVPTKEKYRGWRTALLALVMGGVLSEDEAHRAFPLTLGTASEFYREQLFQHRAMKS